MNDFKQKKLTLISFPEAIATTQSLMNQIEAGKLTELEIETQVTSLINSKPGARGFFVAYLTANSPLADHPSLGLIKALKSYPELVGELLVKNVAMSAAMVVSHRRNNDEENAQSSEQVCRRSAQLIKQVNLDLITEELNKLQITLATGEGSYQEFLQKWGYDTKQKENIARAISQI